MIYWLHRLGTPLARWLPLQLSYRVAEVFAPLVFFLWRDKRDYAIDNMRAVLGETATGDEVRRLACRSFVNYAKYMVDMLRMTGTPGSEIESRINVEGWEHFADAFEVGRGVVFVGGHLGNSDVAVALLAGRGVPVHIIADTLQPPKWDALVQGARRAVGIRVIPMEVHAMRFLKVLREKEVLAILIDRPMGDEGIPVQFFGRTARVPGGAAALALHANAQVLAGFVVRKGNAYIGEISPPFDAPRTGDARHDQETLTQALFEWMEQVIRRYPDQWFMFRPMWPT